jgi:hypothetical protein
VQGHSDPQREFLDVESVAGHLLSAGSVYAVLAAHRQVLFPDELFADMFLPGRGRPSVPGDVMATVIVLQTLNGLSDREAMEALTFDLRWKAACGLPVTAAGFHPTTLTYWRKRLAASDRPNRIFEAVAEVITATGILAGRRRRALDSTVLADAVATQDTVTQLIAAVRRVMREVPGAAEVVAARCTGHDYTVVGKPRIAWDDRAEREALVSALVNDALVLLANLDTDSLTGAAGEAVALLALVAGQDVEPAEGSDGTDGRWRIARRVAPDRVISTVDTEARHAHKSRANRTDGYKAHIAAEPDTGIITATKVTKASGPDSGDGVVGVELIAADPTVEGPVQVLGDSAYGTGHVLDSLSAAGHDPVIKPWPVNPHIADGFTVEDFEVDETNHTVTCPADVTVTFTAKRAARFTKSCTDCPLRARCTTAKRGRVMKLHPQDALLRAHRAKAKDPDFQDTYRAKRPLVERTLSWLTRGNRKLRYRGVTKNDAWLARRAAAINLQRLANLGLNRTNGTWTLA